MCVCFYTGYLQRGNSVCVCFFLFFFRGRGGGWGKGNQTISLYDFAMLYRDKYTL